MLSLQTTRQYRKDRKAMMRRGLPMNLLDGVLELLVAEKPLDPQYRDHALIGNYAGFRECHILKLAAAHNPRWRRGIGIILHGALPQTPSLREAKPPYAPLRAAAPRCGVSDFLF